MPYSGIDAGATAAGVIADSVPFSAGNADLRIVSLLVVEDTQTATGTYLYMGTRGGIYVGLLDEGSNAVFASTPTRISGSEGMTARMLEGMNVNDSENQNAVVNIVSSMTPRGAAVYYHNLENSTSGTAASFPFYGGFPCDLPEDVNQTALYPFSGHAYLLIAGKKGLNSFDAYFYVNP